MKQILLPLLTISFLVACALPLSTPPESADEATGTEPAADSDDETAAGQEQQTLALQVTGTPAPLATIVVTAQSGTGNDTGSNDAASTMGSATAAGAEELTTAPLAMEMLDLAAEDRTFLEAISAARGEFTQIDEHRYLEVTDSRGLLWQGEALLADGLLVVLMQPAQAGGQLAVRLSADVPEGVDFSALSAQMAELLATVDATLPDPDSFGLPDAEIQLVRARETAPNGWNFDVRLNHPDTGWEDYTDGWHIETLDGQILGVRILLHPHVSEMPFTRSQGGIAIPEGVTEVQVRSHDLVSGYGLETVVVPIGESGSGERYEVTRGSNN